MSDQVLPPDEQRALEYQRSNYVASKVLLPDGRVVTSLPVDVTIEGEAELTTRWEFAEASTVVYIGEADPGSLESEAVWRIQKAEISSGKILWAGGAATFVNRWDQRTILSYS